MFSAVIMNWRREQQDERERTRLQLVGLAAEVATVAERIQAELPAGEAVEELRSRCRLHRATAMDVLAIETRFEDYTDEELRQSVRTFRRHQREVLLLRGQAARFLGDLQIL